MSQKTKKIPKKTHINQKVHRLVDVVLTGVQRILQKYPVLCKNLLRDLGGLGAIRVLVLLVVVSGGLQDPFLEDGGVEPRDLLENSLTMLIALFRVFEDEGYQLLVR